MIFVSEDDGMALWRSIHCKVDTSKGNIAMDAAGYGHEYFTKLGIHEPTCKDRGIWKTEIIWILRKLWAC